MIEINADTMLHMAALRTHPSAAGSDPACRMLRQVPLRKRDRVEFNSDDEDPHPASITLRNFFGFAGDSSLSTFLSTFFCGKQQASGECLSLNSALNVLRGSLAEVLR